MTFKRLKSNKSRKGFTLIEALVAITILLIAIVAPLQIAYRGIAMTAYAKNLLVAQYLAQDAMEHVVAKIKNNEAGVSGSVSWLNQLGACTYTAGSTKKACYIDTIGDLHPSCSRDTTPADPLFCDNGILQIDWDGASGSGVYQSKTGPLTSFKRVISIVDNTADDEVQITVAVSWGTSIYAVTGPNSTNLTNTSLPESTGNSYVIHVDVYKIQ
jgi:prepilin-type N-terminal cleavage/methylation domain-containing protein